MIGKIVKNILVLSKGYKLNNYLKNEFFEISDEKIVFYKKSFVLVDNKIKILKEVNMDGFKRALISESLNKNSFLNDLVYMDDKDFIFMLKDDFNYRCKEFDTKFDLIKRAEEFFASFIKDAKNKEEFMLIFSELYFNAYEHGNLGLTFEEKEELIKNDKYIDFVKKGNDKKIRVCISKVDYKDKKYLICKITDEGEGFDVNKQINAKYNGRGIILSEKFCKALFYNEKGNSVMFIKEIK